jgi:pimeloyl-ACP methyl ester carboxylesterase
MTTSRLPILAFMVVAFCAFLNPSAIAGEHPTAGCRVLLVTFVGGLGPASFPPTMATPAIHSVRDLGYAGVCIKTVSSYWPWSATHWVRKQFAVTEADEPPKIIVFGYSLGASHAIRFAWDMQQAGIPIELLITVDGKGPTNGIIPGNVKKAENFYERWLYPLFYPLYYGKKNIKVADPARTNFLGNTEVLHAGHLTIVKMSHVSQLLCEGVHEVYEARQTQTRASAGGSSQPIE